MEELGVRGEHATVDAKSDASGDDVDVTVPEPRFLIIDPIHNLNIDVSNGIFGSKRT